MSSAPASSATFEQLLLVGLAFLDDDLPLAREHPGHAVFGGEVAVVLREQVTDLADRPVLVVGQRLNHQRHTAWPVAFVGDLLVGDAGFFTRATANGALDVLARHVVGLGVGDDRAQTRIDARITTAVTGSDGQFLDDAREGLTALGIGGTLLVLDCVPLRMARHGENSNKNEETGSGILPRGRLRSACSSLRL